MSKTVFRLLSIFSTKDFGNVETYFCITSQLFQEHQVGIAKGHRQVLTESRHTHHHELVRLESKSPHNLDHEAGQVVKQFYCHHEYLSQYSSHPKNTANEGICQSRAGGLILSAVPIIHGNKADASESSPWVWGTNRPRLWFE